MNCPPVEEDPRCNPTTEPPTTTAEITSTTAKNTAANNDTIQKPEQPSSNDNSEVIAAVVSIVVAAIIVALVIIIYKFIYKKKCKREGYDDEQRTSVSTSILCMHNSIHGRKTTNLYRFVVGLCPGNKHEHRPMCISVGMMPFSKYVNDGCILI